MAVGGAEFVIGAVGGNYCLPVKLQPSVLKSKILVYCCTSTNLEVVFRRFGMLKYEYFSRSSWWQLAITSSRGRPFISPGEQPQTPQYPQQWGTEVTAADFSLSVVVHLPPYSPVSVCVCVCLYGICVIAIVGQWKGTKLY